ncbi:MAG: hypothetical protein LBT59_01065 [Clostridiales bacterium]|nr:hypothetical protein [Clostridiales bacterium]
METPILDELAQKAFDDRIKKAVEEAEEKACKKARKSLLAAVREAFLDGVNIGCFVKYHDLTQEEIEFVTETDWPTAPVLRKLVVLTETEIPILDVLAQKSINDRIKKATRETELAVVRGMFLEGENIDGFVRRLNLTPEEIDLVTAKVSE